MERIIVATDGSPGADRAIELAARLAHGLQVELFILTVGGEFDASDMRGLANAEPDLGSALDSAAEQILATASGRARRSGATAIRTSIAWGDPAETIIETARRENATMLVVGRRGRGRLAGLLLGSVSQKLASLAGCAVLVVP
jgi:nucleotide-binding universal stress UspA family protein